MLHALGPDTVNCHYDRHPSREAEIKHWPDAGRLFITGLVAIALVVVVLALLQLPARQLHLSSFWLEKGAAGGCVRAAAVLAGVKKLRLLLRRPTFTALPRIMFITNTAAAGISISRPRSSCRPATTGARAAIVLSMGMRPCSGRSVLLFSKVIGVLAGDGGDAGDGGGTSLTITALALLVHGFRQLAIRLSRHQAPALWKQVVGRRWRWPAASCWRRQG